MATIKVTTRNNADARRIGAGQVRVPGAYNVRHVGGNNVKLETSNPTAVSEWLSKSFLIQSYELVES